jgi:MoaA/NifB/PqqE/SkfB family radical SAM enzyme
MRLSILYRGPLSSCNYGCDYCPFAKREEGPEALEQDRAALERFVARVAELVDLRLSILFTPWGEALVRRWYRDAFVALSALPHVEKVAAQTNLAGPTEFLDRCDRSKVALWATFHPSQISRERFVAKVRGLVERGIRLSVGTVAVAGSFEEIEALRREVPPEVYVWVNAAKRVHGPYSEEELARLTQVDPLFLLNTVAHESLGQRCFAGERVVAVDGEGTLRRCHFVPSAIGNLYRDDFREALFPRPCPNASCGCHIGYVHLARLGLDQTFAGGLLERIPAGR